MTTDKPFAYVTLHKARGIIMPFVWYGHEKCKLWRWPWENAREFSANINDYTVNYVRYTQNPAKKVGDAVTFTPSELTYVRATFGAADRIVMHAWSEMNKPEPKSDAERNVLVLRKAAGLEMESSQGAVPIPNRSPALMNTPATPRHAPETMRLSDRANLAAASSSLERLISAWRTIDLTTPPYVLPADAGILNTSIAHDPRYDLHFELFPEPFVGDLKRSRVLILMANAMFETGALDPQERSKEWRKRLQLNLHQDVNNLGFHYIRADANDVSKYWYSRMGFGNLGREVARQRGWSIDHAEDFLASNISVIQFLPYQSLEFDQRKPAIQMLNQLDSVGLVRSFVRELTFRAGAGEVLVIAVRKLDLWGVTASPGILTYEQPWEARFASFSPTSRYGREILKFLAPHQA